MAALVIGDIEALLLPTAAQEKELLAQHQSERPPANKQRVVAPAKTMSSLRRLLVTLLVCFLFSCGLVAALAPRPWQPQEPVASQEQPVENQTPEPEEVSRFSRLLDAVSANTLHDVLHRYLPEQYKHGVFESDQAALEAIHRENAALAVTMAHLAKRDNTTIPTIPPTSVSSNPPTSSSTSVPIPPTTSSTPPPTSQTSVPTSSSTPPPTSSSTPPTSIAPPPTTTPPTSSSRTLRPVTSTFTSNINGVPVIVTATKYVEGDVHESATVTRPPGSLHTDAAAGQHRNVVLAVLGAAAAGMFLA